MGHVPDGVFNFIGNAIEVLSAPDRTIQDLKKLSIIFQTANNNHGIDCPNVIQPIRVDKIGRNELCPCGTEKKYKYCHLNQE